MVNSFPDKMQLFPAFVFSGLLVSGLTLADNHIPAIQPDLPIMIDAESADFNYANNQLLFRGLRLDQGTLGIQAELAETDKLDFENGLWIFSGNVVLEADNTVLTCDTAHLTFVDHKLTSAEFTGDPAIFEQSVEESDQINSGAADSITYELIAGTLELRNDAEFFDGTNNISGDLITYNLLEQRLSVGSGDSGPVTIMIEPPKKDRIK
jgi:lipopolysaccharide transport protein LptA